MKLIDNAKSWWKMAVIRVAAIWSLAITAWPLLTETQRNDIMALFGIPPELIGGVTALVMFITLVGARVTKQEALHKDAP